jgi:hypothetical protein
VQTLSRESARMGNERSVTKLTDPRGKRAYDTC